MMNNIDTYTTILLFMVISLILFYFVLDIIKIYKIERYIKSISKTQTKIVNPCIGCEETEKLNTDIRTSLKTIRDDMENFQNITWKMQGFCLP